MLERIYGGVRHLGRKGEFRERKRSNWRIRERISAGYGGCGMARVWRRNIPTRRTSRKVHGEEVAWIVGQTIRPRILGKNGKKLETMEGQKTRKKGANEDNPREKGSQRRKIGTPRMDGGRWRRDGWHGWPILRIVGKFLGTRKLKRGVVSWLGKSTKLLFIFLFFSFIFFIDGHVR